MGQVLLGRSDATGTHFLDRVVESNHLELVPHACDALAEFYQSQGKTSELEDVYRKLSRFQTANDPTYRETENVSAQDEFTSHELHSKQLAELQRVLAATHELASAWLACKVLSHAAQRPLYVLCVQSQTGFFGRSSQSRDAALVSQIIPRVKLPGRVLVIAPTGPFRAVARKIMVTRDAMLVQR